MQQAYLQVGAVTATHGIRGEVKVFPTTDDSGRFKKLKEVLVEKDKDFETLHIRSVRFMKNLVLLSFQEYDNINQVEYLKGKKLFVPRKDAVALEENEYFISELLGLHVCDEENRPLGVLQDVITTGANDVYVVREASGKDLLIPAIADCIRNVDIARGTMTVHLLDGLRDL